jgi:FixJ family two-component response regulator
MVEEYGGVVQFAGLIVQSGINAFLAAEQGLAELPLTRSWGKTTVTEYTVQLHRGHIMRKMEADSFAALVRMADKVRLLHPPRNQIEFVAS